MIAASVAVAVGFSAQGDLPNGSGCAAAIVAISDPFNSGGYFKPALERRGITPVALISSPLARANYRFQDTGWARVVPFTTPADTTTRLLNGSPDASLYVIDGNEPGVIPAGLVRDEMRSRGRETPGNSGAHVDALRDKVKSALLLGDLAPNFKAVTSVEEAKAAAREIGFPVFVKPNLSAGSVGGEPCFNEDDVERNFLAIGLGKPNAIADIDTFVLVQKRLTGTERAFNGFRSASGRVVFSGHQIYERGMEPGEKRFGSDRMLDPNTPGLDYLRSRVRLGLQRLNVVGPFHFELIDDKIIDAAGRLPGGGFVLLEAATGDIDPVELTIDGYLFPEKFAQYPDIYSLRHHGATVVITSNGNATASHRLKEEFDRRKVAGDVIQYAFLKNEGEPLLPTKNVFGVVGLVLVKASNAKELEERIARVKQQNRDGLFETAL